MGAYVMLRHTSSSSHHQGVWSITTTADPGTTPPEIAPPGLAMATSAPELARENALMNGPALRFPPRYVSAPITLTQASQSQLDLEHIDPYGMRVEGNALMNLDDRECSVCECTCPTGWHRCPEHLFGPGECCLTQAEYDQKMYGYTDE